MTDSNKETLIQFAKVAGFGLACFIAIIATCGVWNGVTLGAVEAFYGWVAGINLAVEGFGFYKLFKKLFHNDDDKKVDDDKTRPDGGLFEEAN